jgi:hypothetical protein
MKIIKIIIATSILFISSCSLCPAQQADEQKIKDALIISTIKIQELEKQNVELKSIIQRVSDDLKLVKTIVQLDSLKTVYGIVVDDPKKKKVRDN